MREVGDPPSRPDPLDTSLLFDVFALNQAVGRLLATAMRDGPLTPAEYAIYSAMFELESATPTVLATRLGMRLTTFMDQLRLVEGRGHARRMPNPRDGRSQLVTLTATGLAAHRAANRLFEAAYESFASELGGSEAPAKRVLATIRAAAERAMSARSEPEPARVVAAAKISPRPSRGRAG